MSARRLDPLPAVPRTGGLLGELESLHHAMAAAGGDEPQALLLGVSGLAFSFGFRVGAGQDGSNPQFGWFRPAVWDGPDPLRLAARLAGFDYTPHLVNSTSSMVRRIQASIDDGLAALSFSPTPPHNPVLVVGYADLPVDDRDERVLEMLEWIGGSGQVVKVPLPEDPQDLLLDMGPWRNFVGILCRRQMPDAGSRRNQVIAAMRRATARPMRTTTVMRINDMDNAPADIVRPSYATIAKTVRDGNAPGVVHLAQVLDDLCQARRGAAGFLREAMPITELDLARAAEAFDGIGDALATLLDRLHTDTDATQTTLEDPVVVSIADRLETIQDDEAVALETMKAALP